MRINDSTDRPLVWTLVEDISERKKVELMKTEFISTVSHELRTPLTSISGSLGLIEGGSLGDLPENISRMVSIAYRNSKHLKYLVDDLLDMEKLVSGKMMMEFATIAALGVIEESIERLTPYALDRDVSIAINSTAENPLIRADQARLEQAFANLLSNAIKFSPDSSRVDVQLVTNENHLQIRVEDSGPGIPESFRSQIFQKFAQADSSDTRSKGGTGLGLAITKEIMEQMGGSVGFESSEGCGATFWLQLPVETGR
jgi:signal transduction histidine kinase